MRPYLAQIRSNLRLMTRDRTVLFSHLIFPVMFFTIFRREFRRLEESRRLLAK